MSGIQIKYLNELKEFLSFPSVSADPSKKPAVRQCAQWLQDHLKLIGLKNVNIYSTSLHPIVYAEHIVDDNYPTVLFYGHYDVQPADPLAKWKYPPFKPLIINNHIYGRGASDDKGQLFIHIKAIEQMLKEQPKIPLNIRCLFEGEEEIGSPNMKPFLLQHKDRLKCDVAVISDTKILSVHQPAITYSLRGSVNLEVKIQGQEKDLHSGTFGGMIENPAQVMSGIVNEFIDKNNRVAVPGFYSDVVKYSQDERQFIKQNGPEDQSLLKDAGALSGWGESTYSLYERTVIRPSLEICGLVSGYTGEGIKNVIPSEAAVKLNIRLVPRQDPQHIANSVMQFFKNRIPKHFKVSFRLSAAVKPVELSRTNVFVRAAAMAYQESFHTQAKFLRSGGTIPVVSMIAENLKIPVVLMGFALASDNMHAPNEKFYLPNFFRGIQTIKCFAKKVSGMKKNIYADYR